MKNVFWSVLITILILPAFTPWLPHGAMHTLHDHQAEHHNVGEHEHKDHGHDVESKQAAHHPIHFDVATYFSDYLHVNLHSPNQIVMKAPVLDVQDIDYPLVTVVNLPSHYELASVQNHALPDVRRLRPDKTPLYLSTQRLRI